MRFLLRSLLCAVLVCGSAAAQSKPATIAAEILGTWEGESKCTVPSSPCRDEHVVYEIAEEKTDTATLKMDGYKIVNGERQFMGTLRCNYNTSTKNLSCTSRGKGFDDWQYTFSGDTLQGTLTVDSGKTLYRKITVKKKPSS